MQLGGWCYGVTAASTKQRGTGVVFSVILCLQAGCILGGILSRVGAGVVCICAGRKVLGMANFWVLG